MTTKDDMTPSQTKKTSFNVREFARTARGNHRAELVLDEYETKPLASDTLRALSYLRDLESATMQWLRNVLVTPTHKDARVTAFLVSWAFEKFWIADAITAVIEANGYTATELPGAGKRRHPLSEAGDRTGPVRRAISAIVIGPDIVAVHMATELVDQWVTHASYDRVAEVAASEALTGTIRMILEVKKRHEEFFAEESERRLSESAKAARLTRRALSNAAWPIGAVDRSDSDRTFFERYMFGNEEGANRASEIASRVARLPGIGERVATTIQERLAP